MSPRDEPLAFLHRVDPLAGAAVFVETSRPRLAAATFLDDRECFWDRAWTAPVEPARDPAPAPAFLFHQGFCGSTLLARLLEASGVLVLREPQCLADIAGMRPRILAGQSTVDMATLLDFALGCLGTADEPVLVKPSNWVNSLVGDLCVPGRVEQALFLSMERRAFLTAAFRGGRERLEFCIRLAAEVVAALPRGNALLQEAIGTNPDPLDRAAHIAALLWATQGELFERAIAANGWPESARLEFADLLADPADALRCAAHHLGLPQPAPDASTALDRHSKVPSLEFDGEMRAREDAVVEQHHGARFDVALAWLDRIAPELRD